MWWLLAICCASYIYCTLCNGNRVPAVNNYERISLTSLKMWIWDTSEETVCKFSTSKACRHCTQPGFEYSLPVLFCVFHSELFQNVPAMLSYTNHAEHKAQTSSAFVMSAASVLKASQHRIPSPSWPSRAQPADSCHRSHFYRSCNVSSPTWRCPSSADVLRQVMLESLKSCPVPQFFQFVIKTIVVGSLCSFCAKNRFLLYKVHLKLNQRLQAWGKTCESALKVVF